MRDGAHGSHRQAVPAAGVDPHDAGDRSNGQPSTGRRRKHDDGVVACLDLLRSLGYRLHLHEPHDAVVADPTFAAVAAVAGPGADRGGGRRGFLARVHASERPAAEALLRDLDDLGFDEVRAYRMRIRVGGAAHAWHDLRLVVTGGRTRDDASFALAHRRHVPERHAAEAPRGAAPDDRIARLERAVRREATRFEAAFHASPDACSLLTGGSAVIDVNRAFEVLSGYAALDLIGRTETGIGLWASPFQQQRLVDAEAGGDVFSDLELKLRTGNGAVRTVLASGVRLPDGAGDMRLRMLVDVTERRRSHRELVVAVGRAASADDGVARLLAERVRDVADEHDVPEAVGDLTARELEVLKALGRGTGTARIARDFGLSRHTIRNYISSIYSKIGLHSRAEAIIWAREIGLADA